MVSLMRQLLRDTHNKLKELLMDHVKRRSRLREMMMTRLIVFSAMMMIPKAVVMNLVPVAAVVMILVMIVKLLLIMISVPVQIIQLICDRVY